MSQRDGFLSPLISISIANIRRDNASWFSVAESFNDLGMRVLLAMKISQSSYQQLIAGALFGRTLSSFQSALVLTERGMLADARTVIRAATETAIILAAVVKKASICDLLIDRHYWHHRKIRNAWLADPKALAEMTHQQVDKVRESVADIEEVHPKSKTQSTDPISIYALAQAADVMALYNAVYRVTSGDAAHTSLDALNRHISADANGEIMGLKFVPDVSDLPGTLSDAISVLGHALHALLELFPSQTFSDTLGQHIRDWKSLGIPSSVTDVSQKA